MRGRRRRFLRGHRAGTAAAARVAARRRGVRAAGGAAIGAISLLLVSAIKAAAAGDCAEGVRLASRWRSGKKRTRAGHLKKRESIK